MIGTKFDWVRTLIVIIMAGIGVVIGIIFRRLDQKEKYE